MEGKKYNNVKTMVSVEFDGKNLWFFDKDSGYIKLKRSGEIEKNMKLGDIYEISGLWNKALKFFDKLIVKGRCEDISVEDRGRSVELRIKYDNFDVVINNNSCDLIMKKACFQVHDEGICLFFEGKLVGFRELINGARVNFRRRYYDGLIRYCDEVEFRNCGRWLYVNGIRLGINGCECDFEGEGVIIPKKVDIGGLFKWIFEISKNMKPYSIDRDPKEERYLLRYGQHLDVGYTKELKFSGIYYKCGCVEMDLDIKPNVEYFRFNAKGGCYILHINEKFSRYWELCEEINKLDNKILKACAF